MLSLVAAAQSPPSDLLNSALRDGRASCIGDEGKFGLCGSGPGVKWDLGKVTAPNLQKMQTMPEKERPPATICRIRWSENPAYMECAPLYFRAPK
ncbi:hypothetical protein [Piscinibacter sp. XHJ-5]|uniref:hypothetical protein n=1 Tax=Piscinibacter sp. XHJ-5 TaxID=3037797 RepID=UPI002452BB9D|nr:hypothetical protein [Piscinibacter sp. XHJ-5]